MLQSDIGLIYTALKYDGTRVQKVLEEFPPVKNSDGLQGYARLGYFVNGSANVYAPTDDNSVTGEFGQVLNKYRLVGSQCGQSKNNRGVATVTSYGNNVGSDGAMDK